MEDAQPNNSQIESSENLENTVVFSEQIETAPVIQVFTTDKTPNEYVENSEHEEVFDENPEDSTGTYAYDEEDFDPITDFLLNNGDGCVDSIFEDSDYHHFGYGIDFDDPESDFIESFDEFEEDGESEDDEILEPSPSKLELVYALAGLVGLDVVGQAFIGISENIKEIVVRLKNNITIGLTKNAQRSEFLDDFDNLIDLFVPYQNIFIANTNSITVGDYTDADYFYEVGSKYLEFEHNTNNSEESLVSLFYDDF